MAILCSLALLPASLSIHSKPILHNRASRSRMRAQFGNGGCLSPGEDLPPDYESWMPKRDAKSRRRAGILLHPTSFPGPFGIGDLGPQAFQFLDWLHDAGCSVWQVQMRNLIIMGVSQMIKRFFTIINLVTVHLFNFCSASSYYFWLK